MPLIVFGGRRSRGIEDMQALRARRVDPVDVSILPVLLVRSDPATRAYTIYNKSNVTLYIDFADRVDSDDFMVPIPPDGYYESPNPCTDDLFGVWENDGVVPEGKALIRTFVER